MIITGLYMPFFSNENQSFRVYLFPSHWIQYRFCTHTTLSPLPGEHSGQSPFYRRTHANSTTIEFASYWIRIYTPGSTKGAAPPQKKQQQQQQPL